WNTAAGSFPAAASWRKTYLGAAYPPQRCRSCPREHCPARNPSAARRGGPEDFQAQREKAKLLSSVATATAHRNWPPHSHPVAPPQSRPARWAHAYETPWLRLRNCAL